MTEEFRVWFQTEPPNPSWTAYERRTTGTLSVAADHAEFRPKDGASVRISDVHSVAKGWKQQSHGKWLPWMVDSYSKWFGATAVPNPLPSSTIAAGAASASTFPIGVYSGR